MNIQTATHQNPIITWVLVADAEQAQIYTTQTFIRRVAIGGANKHHLYNKKTGHELVPIEGWHLKAEPLANYQIDHDRRGTTSSSNSPAHNNYEAHSDLKDDLLRNFVKSIVGKLHHDHSKKLFNHLVLVAPPKMIGTLRELLPKDVQAAIVADLPKELNHFHGQELMAHLHDTLVKVHAA
jgi:protein required for attachment to host cells